MPENKNAYLRYRLIDRMLRDTSFVKSREIKEKLEERHDIFTTRRTINKDIQVMQTEMHAPIEYDNQRKAYYYPLGAPPLLPILKLKEDEVKALLFYAKTIRQYKDYPIFTTITRAIKKVLENANISSQTRDLFASDILIDTEKHPLIRGLDFIPEILDSISNHRIIKCEYRKFRGNSKTYLLKPILLREDKQFWYLLAVPKGETKIKTFALDRINFVNLLIETFEPLAFDSEDYFKYSFGITVPDEKPINIIISFDAKQADYIRTLPIHPTQKIITDTKQEFRISVTALPSYEFYMKILSYGPDCHIISPKKIASEVEKKLNAALNKYK